MNGKEKIEKLEEFLGISANQIAIKIGISSETIYSIKNGRISDISQNVANKLLRVYPEISELWLKAGVGPMVVTPGESKNSATASDCSANVIQSPNAITTINAAAMDEIVRNNEFLRDEIRRMHDLIASIVNLKSNGNE